MPTINWSTKVISVLQSELTLVSAGLYELDVNAFRLALKDIEDGDEGMGFPDTHRHNTEVTLSGVTYARTFEIINGYTVAFQNTGTPYRIRCVGANHNLGDVTNFDGGTSLIIGNSAGLVVAGGGGGGLTGTQDTRLRELHELHGLDATKPMTVSPTQRTVGDVDQSFSESGGVVTVQRN